jgi:hypothetical protein
VALVIGKEEETAFRHPLEQDHAGRRTPTGPTSRQSHGVGLGQPGLFDRAEPAAELLERISMEGALRKSRSLCQIPV